MMMSRYLLLIGFVSVLVLVMACSGATTPITSVPTQVVAPTSVPTKAAVPTTVSTQVVAPTSTPATATPKPATAPTAVATSKPGTFGKAELDKIFPPGKGQDLIMQNCVNCHNWVPLVMAGYDTGAWYQNMMNHRERVSGLSDADFKYLYDYLAQSFPLGHPVPTNIPKDLLDTWTSY